MALSSVICTLLLQVDGILPHHAAAVSGTKGQGSTLLLLLLLLLHIDA